MFLEAYDKVDLNEESCYTWSHEIENSDFDLEFEKHRGTSIAYQDDELEVLSKEDSCKMQVEIAVASNFTSFIIVGNNSKTRDFGKGFLPSIATGDGK